MTAISQGLNKSSISLHYLSIHGVTFEGLFCTTTVTLSAAIETCKDRWLDVHVDLYYKRL